jgi:hypothetical protein
MNTEAEINLLRERVRELERSVDKLELTPLKRSLGDRLSAFGLIACLMLGMMAFLGYGIDVRGGPFYFDAHHITTESVTLADPDDSGERWGKIDGKSGTIQLEGEKGSVKIDPNGIEIEGPDGTLVLKPEKK